MIKFALKQTYLCCDNAIIDINPAREVIYYRKIKKGKTSKT